MNPKIISDVDGVVRSAKKPQHQGSLHDQLRELLQLANADGLYDAADWLDRHLAHRENSWRKES